MGDLSSALALKLLGLALIPVAFALWWTTFQVWRGDAMAFWQAREEHPRSVDAMLGRAMARPENRPDAPMNDGMVRKRKDGRAYWYLNRRMSSEQYDRITK